MHRVKICGITNEEDALQAVALGAYALGFIFFTKSPRYISPVKAGNITKHLPPFINRVGVFVNMELHGVLEIARRVGLSSVQLHGDEGHMYCYELRAISSIPIIKVFRVKDASSLADVQNYGYAINALLLDTFKEDVYGGTGEQFNWDLVEYAKKLEKPIILSGGLNPDNVVEAYNKVKPYAIDVNSGVEESPGKKDHQKMKQLFDSINSIA